MDIQDLVQLNHTPNEGVWVTIANPLTAEDLPIRFKICGTTSDRFYALRERLQAEALEAAYDKRDLDKNEVSMRFVAGMVLDIEGIEVDGVKCVDALKVFTTPKLRFIFEQLDMDVKRRELFTAP